MNKAMFSIMFLLVLGLFIAGCSSNDSQTENAEVTDSVNANAGEQQDIANDYVDEQIIDETESIEIGEMI